MRVKIEKKLRTLIKARAIYRGQPERCFREQYAILDAQVKLLQSLLRKSK
jgi:hypothetical protein